MINVLRARVSVIHWCDEDVQGQGRQWRRRSPAAAAVPQSSATAPAGGPAVWQFCLSTMTVPFVRASVPVDAGVFW